MSPITYADLLTKVAGHIEDGTRRARVRRFDTSGQAREALAAYHGLLAALEAHTWAIIRPARLTGVSTGADPTERASVELAAALRVTTGSQDPHPSLLTPPNHPWAQAAMTLRAASDLLAVHHTPSGRPRSPDAEAWTHPASRTASLIHLAHLAGAVLDAEDTLALRAGQSHLSWAEVSRWLPSLDEARRRVAAVTASDPDPAKPSRLSGLGLLGEDVRTDTPAHELTDRITRLRHLTWDRMPPPGHSPATLRDLAILAAATNVHVAALHDALGAASPSSVTALIRRAHDWQVVALDLADYSSPAPADPDIRSHTRSLLAVLREVAPLAAGSRPADPPSMAGHESLRAAVRAALVGTEQIGRWAHRSFERLAASDRLTVRASTLSGEHVTNDPALAAAKLSGGRVVAPTARLAESRALYTKASRPTVAAVGHRPLLALEARTELMIIGRPASF